MAIPSVYHPSYFVETREASMRKLPIVAKAVEASGLGKLFYPPPATRDQLLRIHTAEYVDAVLTGKGPLSESAFGFWSRRYLRGVLHINGGCLLAAELAMEHGIAANIAQGFHHCRPDTGAGFCTFHGLALVAALHPDWKVVILDCDEHAGDGTAEFVRMLPNLSQFCVCGSPLGCKDEMRSIIRQVQPGDEQSYLEYLEEGLLWTLHQNPDLVIYQPGVDSHENDLYSRAKVSAGLLRIRDERVFAFFRERGIPCFFVLAGGYQEPIEERLLPLHLQTFAAAHQVYIQDLNY
jgi:acetoin utilization deacetylase AcuC-like enzyme